MATFDAASLNSRIALAVGPYGNSATHRDKVAPSSAPATSDVLRLIRIPAGTVVEEVIIINDDMDSTTTPAMTCKLGYTPCNSTDGPAADTSYFFAASQTFLQSASRSETKSKPILFDFDVFVDLTVLVPAASFIAGSEVHCIVRGESVGTK